MLCSLFYLLLSALSFRPCSRFFLCGFLHYRYYRLWYGAAFVHRDAAFIRPPLPPWEDKGLILVCRCYQAKSPQSVVWITFVICRALSQASCCVNTVRGAGQCVRKSVWFEVKSCGAGSQRDGASWSHLRCLIQIWHAKSISQLTSLTWISSSVTSVFSALFFSPALLCF